MEKAAHVKFIGIFLFFSFVDEIFPNVKGKNTTQTKSVFQNYF